MAGISAGANFNPITKSVGANYGVSDKLGTYGIIIAGGLIIYALWTFSKPAKQAGDTLAEAGKTVENVFKLTSKTAEDAAAAEKKVATDVAATYDWFTQKLQTAEKQVSQIWSVPYDAGAAVGAALGKEVSKDVAAYTGWTCQTFGVWC